MSIRLSAIAYLCGEASYAEHLLQQIAICISAVTQDTLSAVFAEYGTVRPIQLPGFGWELELKKPLRSKPLMVLNEWVMMAP